MRASARHQLKQDRFAQTVAGTAVDTFSWATHHRRTTIIGGVVAAMVLAAAVGGWFYWQRQGEAASEELGRAMRIYEAPVVAKDAAMPPGTLTFTSAEARARAAQKAFQQIADKYPHTASGRLARYFNALALRDEGNHSAAEAQLKQVADFRDKDVAALARYGLASLYAATNRDADAVRLYKDLADHPTNTVSKSTAQLELAALYEAKQPQDARRIYEQIRSEDPKSAAAQTAAERLSALGNPKL